MVSRRNRPAKEPLSRELIVKTAFELLKEQGMEGMSMRKVAKALDTGPSSLYVYFNNLGQLSSYVLDYGFKELTLPSDGEWKERLFGVLQAYFQLLKEQPGLAEISFTILPEGENYLKLLEFVLEALREGEINPQSAAWGADMMLLYVTSVAFEQHSRRKNDSFKLSNTKAALKNVDSARFPLIHSMNEYLFSGDVVVMERFWWGLEVILKGIKDLPVMKE
ncbi:TetR/AcrR family transcriptional regulator [Paenibacillus paeoniae]|uniref:TetR/AcrR family transcriptional regulator n=1 Tax=Paenibacillus paeoniae TaxID=2292705 RepID=A0A371PPK4_9BACL|nr:TetR/AcrR family transcriptional regulator [Paenibacillus paeoniae]